MNRLADVYIGLNLNVYNDYHSATCSATYDSIRQSQALYSVSRGVLRAAPYETYSQPSQISSSVYRARVAGNPGKRTTSAIRTTTERLSWTP